jgi:uncharacterized alpha-E superfamily protein
MLSRVAENLYWLGRYLERAENTARIVNVNAVLLLDLPKGIAPGWKPLIAISGSENLFDERYRDFDERSVVKFLVGDVENPSSILSSLQMARENTRTIRDIVPREAWEDINELYLQARENLQSGLSKRGRYAYLRGILRGAQTLAGMLAGTMNHDAGYEFLRIGRNLERADMTTRIIHVRSASLLPDEISGLMPFENIQWVSVLKSLTAYQMYRRTMQIKVRRAEVLRFLLQDREFPRAVYRCLSAVEEGVSRLPSNDPPLRAINRLQRSVQSIEAESLSRDQLPELVDQLQIGMGQVHDEITRTYYLTESPAQDAGVTS